MKRLYSFTTNAKVEELRELCDDVAEIEHAPEDLFGRLLAASSRLRTYVVRAPDRALEGICFVDDLPDRREMAFTKTRHLVERRPIAFARSIPLLLDELARRERAAGRDAKPMYMHTPEGDEKSRRWFIRAGCVDAGERGLLCPKARETE